MTTSIADDLEAAMHARDFELAARLIVPYLARTRGAYGDAHEKTAEAFNWLGCICQLTDRFEDAIIAYERALAIGRDDPAGDFAIMVRANLAETYGLMGNAQAARIRLIEALDLHAQRTGPAFGGLGKLYQQTAIASESEGELDDAERYLLLALQVSAGTGLESLIDEVRIHLCRILVKRGDFTTAAVVRDQVLARIPIDAGWRHAWPAGHLLTTLSAAHEIAATDAGAAFMRHSLIAIEPYAHDDEPQAHERLRWMSQALEALGDVEAAERLRLRAASMATSASGSDGRNSDSP
jgi:tetratricopeptide (TPR) repeat protein